MGHEHAFNLGKTAYENGHDFSSCPYSKNIGCIYWYAGFYKKTFSEAFQIHKIISKVKGTDFKCVQYHMYYCDEAKKDYELNGREVLYQFDSSHGLSILDHDRNRIKVCNFKHSDWAYEFGKEMENNFRKVEE